MTTDRQVGADTTRSTARAGTTGPWSPATPVAARELARRGQWRGQWTPTSRLRHNRPWLVAVMVASLHSVAAPNQAAANQERAAETTVEETDDGPTRGPRRVPPIPGDERLELALNVDLTLMRRLCLDLNLLAGLDDDECDLSGESIDDRVHQLSPFAGIGLRITLFPFSFGRMDSQSRWRHLGFLMEYAHSLVVVTRHEYRAEPDGVPKSYTIGTAQQDLKAALVGRIPLGQRPGWQLRLYLGVGWYQITLNQKDYPHDLDIIPEDRGLNPYLPSYTYLTIDTGLRFQALLAETVVPFLSLLVRYGVDKVRPDLVTHYPLSQASRIYGIRNHIVGLEGEGGLMFRLPRGFYLSALAQVIWLRTMYSMENKHRLRGQEEQRIWGNGLIFGNYSDDLIVRLRLTAGWHF